MKKALLALCLIYGSAYSGAPDDTVSLYNIDCKDLYTQMHYAFIRANNTITELSPTKTPKSLSKFVNAITEINSKTNFCPVKSISIDKKYFNKVSSDTLNLIVLLSSFNTNKENHAALIKRAKTKYVNLVNMYEFLSRVPLKNSQYLA